MITTLFGVIASSIIAFTGNPEQSITQPKLLAEHTISLEKRYANKSVNDVFKDNILLNLAYMSGKIAKSTDVQWNEVEKPFHYEMTLAPDQTFAFHDTVLPEYVGKVVQTSHAHFTYSEGFKSDGYLYGDGVCHLASLMYWAAKDAKLAALAPTNHNFMQIPQIPAEFGVAIFSDITDKVTSEKQNLYITNTYNKPIIFAFDYKNNNLAIHVDEAN